MKFEKYLGKGLYTCKIYSYQMVGIKLFSRVGSKGQVVIPKPIRKQLGLDRDTEVVFDVIKDKIVLKKKQSDLEILEDFFNSLQFKGKLPKNIDWDEEYYSQFEEK
ncbi:hypothetical protein COV11_00425 [Candidatus Woesearchaeota archaeon CG10_big_fil_rev_8_21_14_0_10_30_7]|nr:MAG: hypothetical protein COV11_00425 [Candidatus Woesearchaeota archaeon CG10_big_fil_rev_8_21_14_0_10_30_7]